jgi:glycerophosphoryl diester phosphodiesterase
LLLLKEYPFDRRPMICAHRGDTSHGATENTLGAITEALSSGAEMIEIDVQMTSDSVIICHHDEAIGHAEEKITFWKERYPSLVEKLAEKAPAKFEDVLNLAKDKAYLNIEMKEYSARPIKTFTNPLVELVRQNGMHDYVLYSSFRLDYLKEMPWDATTTVIHPSKETVDFFNARSQSPVSLSKNVAEMLPSELMIASRATAYACRLDELSEERQKNIKSRNIHLSVYTITHEAEFQRAMELGARAVVTDIPHELVELRSKLYPL